MKSYETYEALGHILRTFKTAWDDPVVGWQSIPGLAEEPRIEWPNIDDEDEDEKATQAEQKRKPWVRIYLRHQDSDQATFGETGCRVFTREALLAVDIFTPTKVGLKLPFQIAKVAQRAFEGKRGVGDGSGIIFRRVRVRERDIQRQRWYSISVLADVEYDEVL